MKNIFNPYLSNDEKDILWELERLENKHELSTNAELRLSDNATTLCGQTNTVAEPISADC